VCADSGHFIYYNATEMKCLFFKSYDDVVQQAAHGRWLKIKIKGKKNALFIFAQPERLCEKKCFTPAFAQN
jgi:hypothetical protein